MCGPALEVEAVGYDPVCGFGAGVKSFKTHQKVYAVK